MTKRLIELHAQDLSYCDQAIKLQYHKEVKKVLRKLAKHLGLAPSDYDLRSNLGGIAVSGEITLHSDSLYFQVSQSCLSPELAILYRACEGRKDYCGKGNNFLAIHAFRDLEALADRVRKVM